jgi:hypothetical protein
VLDACLDCLQDVLLTRIEHHEITLCWDG